MKTIFLHGALKEQFGAQYTFDIENPKQAISALYHQLKDFGKALIDGEFYLIIGPLKGGYSIDETQIDFHMGDKMNEIHLIPAVHGAKNSGGALKIVIGVALVVTAVAAVALSPAIGFGTALFAGVPGVTWGTLAATGLAITLAGVSTLLTPRMDTGYDNRQPPDQKASFLFTGAVNQSEQGAPIPIVYGKFRTGSIVVSTGLTAEQI